MDILVPDGLQGLLAVKGFKQPVALGGQIDLQGIDDIRLVVTNQNVVPLL